MDTPIYYHSRLVEDHTLRNKNKGIHFITEWQFTRFFDKVNFLLLIFNIHFFLNHDLMHIGQMTTDKRFLPGGAPTDGLKYGYVLLLFSCSVRRFLFCL